jgi:hypothetical protein
MYVPADSHCAMSSWFMTLVSSLLQVCTH